MRYCCSLWCLPDVAAAVAVVVVAVPPVNSVPAVAAIRLCPGLPCFSCCLQPRPVSLLLPLLPSPVPSPMPFSGREFSTYESANSKCNVDEKLCFHLTQADVDRVATLDGKTLHCKIKTTDSFKLHSKSTELHSCRRPCGCAHCRAALIRVWRGAT